MIKDKYPYTILFIEDEKEIRDNYVHYLKLLFSEVYEAADGEEAYKIYREKKPHIMIIDINLPILNGTDLLRKIREKDHTTKAIMLTAHSDAKYLLEVADLKLTKYLIKPINREELHIAINLAIEELSKFEVSSKKIIALNNNWIWNCELNELRYNTELVHLTNKETKVLALFLKNSGKTFTPDDIIFNVWDDYDEGNLDALRTMIKNLRRKLPKDTIKNVFGIGYKVKI